MECRPASDGLLYSGLGLAQYPCHPGPSFIKMHVHSSARHVLFLGLIKCSRFIKFPLCQFLRGEGDSLSIFSFPQWNWPIIQLSPHPPQSNRYGCPHPVRKSTVSVICFFPLHDWSPHLFSIYWSLHYRAYFIVIFDEFLHQFLFGFYHETFFYFPFNEWSLMD